MHCNLQNLKIINNCIRNKSSFDDIFSLTSKMFKDLKIMGYDNNGDKVGTLDVSVNVEEQIKKVSASKKYGMFRVKGFSIFHIHPDENSLSLDFQIANTENTKDVVIAPENLIITTNVVVVQIFK